MTSFWEGFISSYLLDLGKKDSLIRNNNKDSSSALHSVVTPFETSQEPLVENPKKVREISTRKEVNKVHEIPIYGYLEEDEIEALVA